MKDSKNRVPGKRRRALVAGLLASTLLAGGGLAFAQESTGATAATGPLQLPPVVNPAGFSELVAKVRPAIVNIATTEGPAQAQQQPSDPQQQMPPSMQGTPFGEMFPGQQDRQSMAPTHALGSGFLIDPTGYIVTNNHVVDHAHKISVTLNDGNSYPAHVVGRDAKTDLALLKIDAGKSLPYIAFGNSDKARVGDWVVAVGNPFGLGGTVTAGIVSAHDRNLEDGPYDDYLQIDAPINPGNSGGPLFNQSGQVIGIDSAIYSPNGGSVGIGFAIPSNLAKTVVAQLREHGKVERGWLGVAMQPVTPALAKAIGRPDAQGVIVDQVEPNSPAATASLMQGDVITAFDGKAVKTPRDLALDVANTPRGHTVKLTLWREGQERTAEVAIGDQPSQQVAQNDRATGGDARVGMELAPLTPSARSDLGLNPTVNGVVVAGVQPESRAAASGMEANDVILRIGSARVTSPAEAAAQIHQAEHDKKEAVPLLVLRNGTTYYLALQLS